MLQQKNKKNKGRLSLAMPHFDNFFASLHGFTRPPAWVPCLLFNTNLVVVSYKLFLLCKETLPPRILALCTTHLLLLSQIMSHSHRS